MLFGEKCIQLRIPIFAVSQQRGTEKSQMCPDLMGSPGVKSDFAQREIARFFQDTDPGYNLFAAFGRPPENSDSIFGFILIKIRGVDSLRRHAFSHTEVFFVQEILSDKSRTIPQCGVGFCSEDNALGSSIQTIAECGTKRRSPGGKIFSFFFQIVDKPIHQIGIPCAVRVAQDMYRFIEERDRCILIYNLQA